FQWRENEDDGGDVQDEPVTAKADAEANRLKEAATAASWVNYSRLAHRLGLFGIGARADFCPPGFAKTRAAGKAIKLRPADSAAREHKATIMDRIADGIEKSSTPIKVFGPDDINFFAGEFK